MDNFEIDLNYINNGTLEKSYFSKSFMDKYTKQDERFVHKILDYQENEFLLKDECTLGVNFNGKRKLKAIFLEDTRKFRKLILQ